MIKNLKHAKEVQGRRVKAKKFGVAKAVRTWMQKMANDGTSYDALRNELPAIWKKNK